MKKRAFSVFLAALLTVTLLPVPAHAYTFSELTVKELDYTRVENFSEGYAVVSKDVDSDGYQEYGLIDSQGNLVVPLKYDYIGTVSEGFAKIGIDADENPKTGAKRSTGGKGVEKYGFIDVTGKEIVSPIYDSVADFSDGMAVVSTKYQRDLDDEGTFKATVFNYGFVDKTGEVVIPLIYEGVGGAEVVSDAGPLGDLTSTKTGFSEGLASVQNKDGKWGVIDKQGNTVIPFTYDKIGGFSEGLASVGVNDKWGFIDKQGKMVIPRVRAAWGH